MKEESSNKREGKERERKEVEETYKCKKEKETLQGKEKE